MLIEEWPKPLIRDIARRRAIFVIGSGVSRHALGADKATRPPIWKSFLLDAAGRFPRTAETEHIYKAISEGDLLHACEWLKDRYDEDWTAYLRSRFADPNYSPGELHKLIALLDTRVVFSLNFDDIYENKSREINEASQFIKNYGDPDVCEFLRNDARYIVKVHGNLSSPATLIFTQEDYAKARTKHSLFYSAFDAALMTHTFLFIGCGYGDPDINLILENQAFSTQPGSINPHYFLTSDEIPEDMKKSLRKNRNLKTLCYDKIDDDHSGLVAAIESLNTCVTDARSALIESANW
ncbi:SIR2 family NAD-dependent protein deacylase [Sphingobium sp. Leaf26]|uniref:SIR2 family NAD-dependent protein deacylase n=1 Tax=Sphingobium sp. Leaf26 TaxID=1735693 RepID=UPI0009E75360|nr:SIR2 family protein [Sphingobium sp. Leaf26]